MSVRLDSGREYLVGVGITTYQRFDRFKECFENLLKNCRDVDEILIVEDGSEKDKKKYDEYFSTLVFNHIKILRHSKNRGVGISKNQVMRYFYDKGYDYIFTLEDDINVLSPEVFKTYIIASLVSGYEYLNFAQHGTHNKTYYKQSVNGIELKFYPNIVGAFTLYSRKLIETIGYHDERFKNAMEHVEYTYRASLKGLTSRFWHFADVVNNVELLEEQVNSLEDSSIRPREDWHNNLILGFKLFKELHGVSLSEIPK